MDFCKRLNCSVSYGALHCELVVAPKGLALDEGHALADCWISLGI